MVEEGGIISVEDLVKGVLRGEVVLPDFQRSFTWEPEEIRELLVSLLGGYFIGTMLILETVREDSPFALRFIEGAKKVNENIEIQSLIKIILDGQQRTTAIFYALYEPNIPLKGRKNPYSYFLNLEKALNEEWDEAVIGVSKSDKKKLRELKEKEFIIPFKKLVDRKEIHEQFKNHPKFSEIYELIDKFLKRPIHIIKLQRNIQLDKIAETFERINRIGKPLSLFDLLSARLYKHDINLRKLLKETKERYEFASNVKEEYILRTIALIRRRELKAKEILSLNHENFEDDWNKAVKSLQKAYERITDIRDGYGAFDFSKWVPYTPMIVPLAALIHYLESQGKENPKNYAKIDKWYWISVFANRYDQGANTTSFKDYKALIEWIEEDSKIPSFVNKFNISDVDLGVNKQSSATYRGVMNLITLSGALDFQTGQPPQFNQEKVQDDHIFPKSKFETNKINLIYNRTLITTNASKGNKLPSLYFKERIEEYGKEKLKNILATHLIPADAIDDLLSDNIESFLEKRKKTILEKISEIIQ